MKKNCRYFLMMFLILVSAISAFAQSPAKIEQTLLVHLKKIQKWANSGAAFDKKLRPEDLVRENAMLKREFLKYTKLPSTLRYKFGKLDEYMTVTTSEDGKFRVYSWDTQEGGEIHDFANVYQFQTGNGKVYSNVRRLDDDEIESAVYDLFQTETKAGTIYLGVFNSIMSYRNRTESIRLFKIENNHLNENVKLIKTASGLTNVIKFDYDMLSNMKDGDTSAVYFDRATTYDKASKTFEIPLIIKKDDEDFGALTNRFISYKFDGNYFVKIN